jgi:hypothetical protein
LRAGHLKRDRPPHIIVVALAFHVVTHTTGKQLLAAA